MKYRLFIIFWAMACVAFAQKNTDQNSNGTSSSSIAKKSTTGETYYDRIIRIDRENRERARRVQQKHTKVTASTVATNPVKIGAKKDDDVSNLVIFHSKRGNSKKKNKKNY